MELEKYDHILGKLEINLESQAVLIRNFSVRNSSVYEARMKIIEAKKKRTTMISKLSGMIRVIKDLSTNISYIKNIVDNPSNKLENIKSWIASFLPRRSMPSNDPSEIVNKVGSNAIRSFPEPFERCKYVQVPFDYETTNKMLFSIKKIDKLCQSILNSQTSDTNYQRNPSYLHLHENFLEGTVPIDLVMSTTQLCQEWKEVLEKLLTTQPR